MTPQEYVEEVLALVESIPEGRVMSYGAVADALAERSGRNSARHVGRIMALHGGGVPWHRVCNSGALASHPATNGRPGRGCWRRAYRCGVIGC